MMINTQQLNDNLKSQIELVKSGNYPDTLNLLAELQVIVRMIDDLNERIIRIENDLDAEDFISDEDDAINRQIAAMSDEELLAVIIQLAGSESNDPKVQS